MKVVILFLALSLASCGSLVLNPKGCKTEGIWSSYRPVKDAKETKLEAEYFVFLEDKEIVIRDFLAAAKIKCDFVQEMRARISTELFVRRRLELFLRIENFDDFKDE